MHSLQTVFSVCAIAVWFACNACGNYDGGPLFAWSMGSSNMATTVEKPQEQSQPKPLPGRDYPWYSPRFWHGMCLGDWWQLASQNHWRVHPARLGMAATTTMFTACNSLLRPLQHLLHGRAIEQTVIEQPPVFILGHWRSGTTYLHELLMHDERFATPTSFQCFQPHHMLLTEWIVTRAFWWVMPSKRPQDNVSLGWNTPQEDEFALCAMGLPTPYRRMAFPDEGPRDLEYLDMEGLADEQIQSWQAALLWFVKLMTYHTKRQVLLKSPPHTGRIETLAKTFPGAKFIHITRDPYALFSSTTKLWRTLNFAQGFQLSEGGNQDEYVFDCLQRMYAGFQRQREQIDQQSIVDLRYEDLVVDPIGQLRQIYQQLGIDHFDQVEPHLTQYAASKSGYKTNRHQLNDTTRQTVADRWKFYFDAYGYKP